MALPKLNSTQWLICFVASLGFAFDIYALLTLPLIVRPALLELADMRPGTHEFNQWVGMLFYLPAVAGGVFGLLGGYLTDLLGRRRVLVWSILIYAGSAAAAGYATSLEWLLVFRCATFVGVSVEFVAAVAWLAELFPDRDEREGVLGFTQAFSSAGGILVTGAYYLAVTYGDSFPEIRGGHEAWRYTLLSGLIPAIPLMIIRPFLPESPMWQQKKLAGTLKRPSIAELFSPALRRTTIVTTIMFACAYGAAFGAIQHVPRIVPGMAEVQGLEGQAVEQTVSAVQAFQEVGGLLGRFALAFLAIYVVSRRKLLYIFLLPGMVILPWVLLYPAMNNLTLLKWGILLGGLVTVAQFSFWGNYLPRVYPTHLRGTGESFAANIGGRMIGTCAAWVTTTLANHTPGQTPSEQLAYAAAYVAIGVYAIGFVCSFWLPEPAAEELPE